MQITLEQLFYGDRATLFKINPGDVETPANISVASVKEMALTINGMNGNIRALLKDLERAEARIEKLECAIRAIADYHE